MQSISMSMIENYMDEHMHEYTTFDQINTSKGDKPSLDYDSEVMNQMGPKAAAQNQELTDSD